VKRFFKKLRYVHLADLLSVFLLLLAVPYAAYLRSRRPHIWLICERRMEARDNGYWLFKYLCGQEPQVDAVYVIDRSSPDFRKVARLGKETIPWGGIRHWAYYLAAENNISSQKDGKPNAALCYLLEVYEIRQNRRVFLQHGIIHNDNEFLHYENTKMGLFVCGAKPEYDFVKNAFGYPEGSVRYLGLARFDGLYGFRQENFVLVMPTWRKNIATPAHFSKHLDSETKFKGTVYYKRWHSLLTDEKLREELRSKGCRLVFYPHPNMQRFLDIFREDCNEVEFCDWHSSDVQDLLRRAAFLITDYSSVAMDFAYMGKPLLYYQFDLKDFRQNQYAKGYFDYRLDGFGPVCRTQVEVRETIEKWMLRQRNEGLYIAREQRFFELHDQNNCMRNYKAIRDWGRDGNWDDSSGECCHASA
jgi:hypothetical protein